ncbi:MAG: rRNA maturation RNase YbeY [Legionellales bacterium]|nr:rRNA maturation RNase YbeY [Legionellales bacterium]|tara:strand:- start:73512 stop:73994 length:483 start_codon:yes stop_codon:yes gene_type:complete
MTIQLDLQIASDADDVPSAENFEQWVNAAVQAGSQREDAELTIRIVDEAEGTELNETYRDKQGPTNVLSFPFDVPEGVDIDLLGDIVICAPVMAQEAAQQGKQPIAHWAHLTIHGTLHLLGYDHIEDDEAEIMENLETQILAQLGYPNPYEPHYGVEITS